METTCRNCRSAGVALMVLLPSAVADAQETVRVSVSTAGAEGDDYSWTPSISADGHVVAFASLATNLVAGDTNGVSDVFVHDRATGITERISVDSSGLEGNEFSWAPSISADGNFVAFTSAASNLVAGDTNQLGDVFVHDRSTGVTERVSVDSSGAEADGGSDSPFISADGNCVAFRSFAALEPGGSGQIHIYVHDRSTGITERVSVKTSGQAGNDNSFEPALSADGQFVAFTSEASNLVSNDKNDFADVFVRDRSAGTTERVSVSSSGIEGNSYSMKPSISADGAIVAFTGVASNLVVGDTSKNGDIFVRDRATGVTERVSVSSSGAEGDVLFSDESSVSADGTIVAFYSYASNFVAGDTGASDVFIHDRSTGLTDRVSVDSAGVAGDYHSYVPSISADGKCVAFESYASNLVADDTNWFMTSSSTSGG